MGQERTEILRMVAEKKISVEEAERLLRAIEDGDRLRPEGTKAGQRGFRFGEFLGDVGSMVQGVVEEAASGIGAAFGDEEPGGEVLPLAGGRFEVAAGSRLMIRQRRWKGRGDLSLAGVEGSVCELVGTIDGVRAFAEQKRLVVTLGEGSLRVAVPASVAEMKAVTMGRGARVPGRDQEHGRGREPQGRPPAVRVEEHGRRRSGGDRDRIDWRIAGRDHGRRHPDRPSRGAQPAYRGVELGWGDRGRSRDRGGAETRPLVRQGGPGDRRAGPCHCGDPAAQEHRWSHRAEEKGRMSSAQAPSRCPACGNRLRVKKLCCDRCAAEVQGDFQLCSICSLEPELRKLLELFLRARGNLKEVQRAIRVSYPTVRQRMEELFRRLEEERDPPDVIGILGKVDRGELSVDEAERALRGDGE